MIRSNFLDGRESLITQSWICHHVMTFFGSHEWNQWFVQCPEKSHFDRCLGSIVHSVVINMTGQHDRLCRRPGEWKDIFLGFWLFIQFPGTKYKHEVFWNVDKNEENTFYKALGIKFTWKLKFLFLTHFLVWLQLNLEATETIVLALLLQPNIDCICH